MKTKYILLPAINAIFITLDQWTKLAIVEHFYLGESIPVIEDFFNLTYVRNPGAAFGMFAQAHPQFRVPFFIIVPLIALGIIFYIFRKIEDQDYKLIVALSLIISGAVGNLIDRARLNYVIDFLDFHWKYKVHFPAFNVADIVICLGVGLLLLDMIQKEKAEKHKNVSNPV